MPENNGKKSDEADRGHPAERRRRLQSDPNCKGHGGMGPHHHGAHLSHGRLRRRVRRLRGMPTLAFLIGFVAVLFSVFSFGIMIQHFPSSINLHLCEPRVRQAARLHRRLADAVAVLGEPGHGVPHRGYRHSQHAAGCADSGSVLRVPHYCGHRVAYRHEDRHGGEQSALVLSWRFSRCSSCAA